VSRATHSARRALGLRGPRIAQRELRRSVERRVVLVTGASEGIGEAAALRLGAAGATVLLTARTVDRLAQVRDTIVAAGGTAHVHPADLACPEAAAALGEEILARHGRVDVVVSNAGHSIRRSAADTADRFHDVERLIGVNHLGPVRLLLRLLPAMRAAGRGHIVNVSTASIGAPAPHWSGYLSSKAAFDTWLRCVAPEASRDGVTVATVYLGLVRTRMSAPTEHYRRIPAMSAAEAADVVCHAIATRRSWRPWWSGMQAVTATAAPTTARRLASGGLRALHAAQPVVALAGTDLWSPTRLARVGKAATRHGLSLTALAMGGHPSAVALVDPSGPVTVGELTAASERCARTFRTRGIRARDRVGISVARPRDLVAAVLGVLRAGADAVLLPPDSPPDRLQDMLTAGRVTAAVHDADGGAGLDGLRSLPWPASAWDTGAEDGRGGLPPSLRAGRIAVFTSGTTGTPRMTTRPLPLRVLLGPVTTHLQLIPIHAGEPIVIGVPLYHGYGISYLAAALALGAPAVVTAGLPPQQVLDLVHEYRAATLVALPVQLRRLAELPDEVVSRLLPGPLRAVVSGAEPLTPAVYAQLRPVFGERIFNLFGSTEAGWAAIATPADLRAAPGTVGRAPRGITLRIVDTEGRVVPPGCPAVGEVYVRGWRPDGGWTPTGDLGHIDVAGRLFLDGRRADS
jgi:NAD(P)-dependent dehydrogenase (short-subunit alcohol dehydrogenase family)